MNIEKIKDFKNLIFLVVVVILLIANYAVYSKYAAKKKEFDENFGILNVNEEIEKEDSNENNEDDILEELKDMEERDRMEFYFSEFIDGIEDGDYQKSYDLLYDEFKNRYFPTMQKFVQYVEKIYNDSPGFEYKDIERQGNIYILTIDIVNYKDKSKNKSQRIIIKENDFNDFVISFQVI